MLNRIDQCSPWCVTVQLVSIDGGCDYGGGVMMVVGCLWWWGDDGGGVMMVVG